MVIAMVKNNLKYFFYQKLIKKEVTGLMFIDVNSIPYQTLLIMAIVCFGSVYLINLFQKKNK